MYLTHILIERQAHPPFKYHAHVYLTARADVGGAQGRQSARPVQLVSVGLRAIGGGGTRAAR